MLGYLHRMIAKLTGTLDDTGPDWAVIDVGGVGYLVHCSAKTLDGLGIRGDAVVVHTELQVSENDMRLIGFSSGAEREWFRLLTAVQGVGSKMALAVLSGLPVGDFKQAVIEHDVKTLARIKGLGSKTAERIVLELKDKVGVVSAWKDAQSARATRDGPMEAQTDAVLGLIALGFKQTEAQKAVAAVMKSGDAGSDPTPERLIREALRSGG